MKQLLKNIALAMLFLAPTIHANPTVYPLGTTIYKPDKCWNGYTILSADKGLLIDMNGNLVHMWKGKLHHPNKVYPGGHLLSLDSVQSGHGFDVKGVGEHINGLYLQRFIAGVEHAEVPRQGCGIEAAARFLHHDRHRQALRQPGNRLQDDGLFRRHADGFQPGGLPRTDGSRARNFAVASPGL